jgi:hypothetical protein
MMGRVQGEGKLIGDDSLLLCRERDFEEPVRNAKCMHRRAPLTAKTSAMPTGVPPKQRARRMIYLVCKFFMASHLSVVSHHDRRVYTFVASFV